MMINKPKAVPDKLQIKRAMRILSEVPGATLDERLRILAHWCGMLASEFQKKVDFRRDNQ